MGLSEGDVYVRKVFKDGRDQVIARKKQTKRFDDRS